MTSFDLTGSINVPTIEDAFALVGSRLQPGVGPPADLLTCAVESSDQADSYPGRPPPISVRLAAV